MHKVHTLSRHSIGGGVCRNACTILWWEHKSQVKNGGRQTKQSKICDAAVLAVEITRGMVHCSVTTAVLANVRGVGNFSTERRPAALRTPSSLLPECVLMSSATRRAVAASLPEKAVDVASD
jgi:hypothetical protein